jgi:hypothetical protein
MTTLKFDMINILEQVTPICTDVLKLIADYAEPVKFEVDKVYTSNENKKYRIVNRTKCFIDMILDNRKTTYIMRFKIRYTDIGDEYLHIWNKYEILNI